MEKHLENRPKKRGFPVSMQEPLRNRAIEKIKNKFLPDDKIIKIYLVGSSVKNTFGEYDPPGFRGSLFSDFDFIVFVEDDFIIPDWLDREPSAKPFPNNSLNLAFRSSKFIDNKYDIEVFFVRKSTLNNKKTERLAEMPGCEIPFSENSKWKHIVVYSR